MATRITAADLPPRSEHRHLVLRWLLDHPGEQARRDVVDGAVNLGRFPSEWCAIASTHASRRYASALHQDVYFLIWDLREAGVIEAPRRGMYRLTRRGRREALVDRRRRRPNSSARQRDTATHRSARPGGRPRDDDHPLGRPYTPIDLHPTSKRPQPFAWDPDEKDRETAQHHQLLDRLAREIIAMGHQPRLPRGVRAVHYDLAFEAPDRFVVIEVKSLPSGQEHSQLRLGLGQVLEYRTRVRADLGDHVDAVLAVPRRPPQVWATVCEQAGVKLIWPPDLAAKLSARQG